MSSEQLEKSCQSWVQISSPNRLDTCILTFLFSYFFFKVSFYSLLYLIPILVTKSKWFFYIILKYFVVKNTFWLHPILLRNAPEIRSKCLFCFVDHRGRCCRANNFERNKFVILIMIKFFFLKTNLIYLVNANWFYRWNIKFIFFNNCINIVSPIFKGFDIIKNIILNLREFNFTCLSY